VGLIRIDARAFAYNKTLESIVIPNSVTEIGGYAFSECGLTSVTLGNRVQEIRGYAFSQNKLTEIILPASLKFMGSHAFGENQITSLTIPNGVICISGTFIGNPIVTLVLPASLAKQGPWGSISYEDDRGGRNIYTPGSISGFRDCPLTRITFPANMDDENLSANFDTNLVNAYKSQNRAAGTYVKNGPVWSKQ
jgi:hypothetical protein